MIERGEEPGMRLAQCHEHLVQLGSKGHFKASLMGRKLLAQDTLCGHRGNGLCTINERSRQHSVALAEQRVDDDEDHHRAHASAAELLGAVSCNEGLEKLVHGFWSAWWHTNTRSVRRSEMK